MTDAFTINNVSARWVIDSRGNPTISATVSTKKASGTALVPSGASTGIHEAVELRDGGKPFAGKGVKKAVNSITRVLAPALKGIDVRNQKAIDSRCIGLDGKKNKSRLGANAILGVSLASFRASAASQDKQPYQLIGSKPALPIIFSNVINGGKHAGNGIEIQEFMLAPYRAHNYEDALTSVCETYYELKTLIEKKCGKQFTGVGDEGGFAPPLDSKAPLELMQTAADAAGHSKMGFAIDAAASSFYKKGGYVLGGKTRTAEWMIDFYEELLERHHNLISIEDPFSEDDWPAFTKITNALGKKVQIVGDDLLVTNPERIKKAIKLKACTALLLKVNQIGTLTEALAAADLARTNKMEIMVSHRSGETEDPFISDLAVGLACGQIKAGAPCRGERTVKYNRLLTISESVKKYVGRSVFR